MRVNALDGTSPATLAATYNTRPLTSADFVSSIFPANAIRDSLIQAEGTLAGAIAKSDDRSQQAYLRTVTASLASGAALPSTIATGQSIIGYGAVRDASSSVVLTRLPVPLIRNRLLSPGIYLVPTYNYALAGGEILHTRTTVTLECYVYDADDQTTIFDANGPMLLSDSLAEAVICGGCAMLVRDDEFMAQAQIWANYFAVALAAFPPAKMEQVAA